MAAIERMLTSLGVASEVQSKVVLQTIAGRAAESVALGEHELAFAPVTEIVGLSGVEVLGLWWEDGFAPERADGFASAMRDALHAYLRFAGADRLEWAAHLGDAQGL